MDGRIDRFIDMLWETYKTECPYAAHTEKLFGSCVCDHIAFRSVRTGYDTGEDYNKRVFGIGPIEAMWGELGWKRHSQYTITDKNIYAIHMEPPIKGLPKIFISEFMTENLEKEDRAFINKIFCKPREIITADMDLSKLSTDAFYEFFHTSLYPETVNYSDLDRLDKISQYLAWVRLFGRKPNHFTLLCGEKNSGALGCGYSHIKATYEEMEAYGIPMKPEIEGDSTEFAQSSTEAAEILVCVLRHDNKKLDYIKWPYAYYEIAERGMTRFEGFKVEQTKSLFDMTKKKEVINE